MEAWDDSSVLLAGTRCRGGRAVVGEALLGVEEEAVSMGSLRLIDEGLGVWVISA